MKSSINDPIFSLRREDPPSESTMLAGQELLRLTEDSPNGLTYLDPVKDFNMKYIDVVDKVEQINQLEASINSYGCIDCPQFTQHVCLICLLRMYHFFKFEGESKAFCASKKF